jgi:hypothetical protein
MLIFDRSTFEKSYGAGRAAVGSVRQSTLLRGWVGQLQRVERSFLRSDRIAISIPTISK